MADEPALVRAGASPRDPSAEPSRRSKILRRTRVGGTLVAVLVGLFWIVAETGSPWFVWVVGLGLGLGATLEAGRMLRASTPRATSALLLGWAGAGAASAVCIRLATTPGASAWLITAAVAAAVGAAGAALRRGPRPGPSPLHLGGLAAWIGPPLPLLGVAFLELGLGGLIALVTLSKIGDIAGYYAGNALGKHHPFPRLSPGKTTEGCVASFAFALLAAALLSATGVLPLALLPALAFGAAVNLASQGGDLAESALKRATGVKDSGTWFGPSGGFLDLTDSLLFSVPVGLAVLAALPLPTAG